MFASDVTDVVEIGDVRVTIRKLNQRKLRDAAEARTEQARADMKKMPEAVVEQMVNKENPADGAAAAELSLEKRRELRYALYDRDKVLRCGIKDWSDTSRKVSPESIDDLDEVTANTLHRAILDLSLPPLEEGAEEAARKNS